MRLAEADLHHLSDVLLFQIVLVQLLNTRHLTVVEPIRRLGYRQFIDHLSIKLTIIDLASVVDILPIRNRQADITTTTCGIRQRMGIVRGSHK